MRRRAIRMMAVAMTAVMVLSVMTGCKGKKSKEKDADADEYAYKVETTKLDSSIDGSSKPVIRNGVMYFINYNYTDNYESYTITLNTMNIETGDITEIAALYDSSKEDNTFTDMSYVYPCEDGTYRIFEQIYDMGDESEDTELPEDVDGDDTITEDILGKLGYDLGELGLTFDDVKDMTVNEVIKLFTGEKPGTEESKYDGGKCLVLTLDSKGQVTDTKDISDKVEIGSISYVVCNEDAAYFYSETWQEDGSAGEYKFVEMNWSTGEAASYTVDSSIVNNMIISGDKVVATFDGDNGMYPAVWDTDKHEFTGDEDSSFESSWAESIYPGYNDNTMFYITNDTLYTYDMENNSNKKMFKFTEYDIAVDTINMLYAPDEEHIYMMTTSYEEGTIDSAVVELYKLTRVKASEIESRTEITLACLNSDSELSELAAKFNRSNTEYKIVIKEYYDYDSEEEADYDASIKQFKNDITSGNAADIVDLSGLDYDTNAKLGLFEDLSTYLEKDSELSSRNLNMNIINLFKKNGTLCALPASFMLEIMAASKDYVGEGDLTIDKFAEVVMNNPDKTYMGYVNREDVLSKLLTYAGSDFIDYDNKTCNFTDGTFEKLLNAAAMFPTQEELDKIDYSTAPSEAKELSDGNQIFYNTTLYGLVDYYVIGALLDDNYSVFGYPSINQSKVGVSVTSPLLGIVSTSKYKDKSWEFVKTVFTRYLNTDEYDQMSVDNDILNEMITKAATPQYQMDEDGNYVLDENGNKIEEPYSNYSWSDVDIEIYAFSDKQVEELKDLVNRADVIADNTYYSGNELYDIINEEAGAFFSGDKSAEEVCKLIQSRVQIYVNEQ